MQEIGLESSILQDVLDNRKTIEGRLGRSKFLKIKVGDKISLREDVWENGSIVESVSDRAIIKITQVLYFESFKEMFGSLNFNLIIPSAKTPNTAVAFYRQFYSEKEEFEYGVVAFIFELMPPHQRKG